MSFSDGKEVPLGDFPLEGPHIEKELKKKKSSQNVIIHLTLLAAISEGERVQHSVNREMYTERSTVALERTHICFISNTYQ